MKKEEDYNVSETGNWNVASEYSRLKIMKPLFLADEYQNIAMYGFSSLLEELTDLAQIQVEVLRIKGMERLVSTLILLIDNSLFAVKTERETLENLRKDLIKIQNIVHVLYNNGTHNKKKIIRIREKEFDGVIKKLAEIKTKINEPLNKNHLIFTSKEDFNPKKFKDRVKDRMINEG